MYTKSVANDCKSACITILDQGCANPYRMCATCRDRKRCDISVKFAHDALCGVCGLVHNELDIDHLEWKALKDWQKQYHTLNPNPHIY